MATSIHTTEGFHLWRILQCTLHPLGYRYEDSRRDSIVEHLIVNNLGISNIHNTDAAFQNKESEGRIVALVWSDLIMSNLLTLPNITIGMFQIPTLAPITNTYGLFSHNNFIYTQKMI